MSEARNEQDVQAARLVWIEPEVKVLNIGDTKFADGYGGDFSGYGADVPDLTAS